MSASTSSRKQTADPSATRRAVIYARQSVTRDGSESLDAQVERCREAAGRFGLEVVAELVEPPSTSGFKNRGRARPRFAELLELIRVGEVDVVIAYQTDRLSRGGGPGWAPLLEAFEAAGHDIDRAVATPMGYVSEFEIGIRATTDREESKKTAMRVADSHARRARDGKALHGGPRPFGYEEDRIHLRPAEAVEIRNGIERLLAGESLHGIAGDWNARGVPTVGGGAWVPSVVRQTLLRPRNWGVREHHGVAVAQGEWEAIVDTEIGERLRAHLSNGARLVSGGVTARKFLLPGFLLCGKCGAKMINQPADAHHQRSYRCSSTPGRGCGGTRIVAEPLEGYVLGAALRHLDSPRLAERLQRERDDTDDNLGVAIAAEEAKLNELAAAWANDHLTQAQLLTASDAVNARLAKLRRQLVTGTKDRTLARFVGQSEAIAERWGAMTIDQKRVVLGAAIESVTVVPALVVGRKTFDTRRVKIRRR